MTKKREMKLFELKGTLRFYAKDVDDAFRRIGKHYLTISREGVDSPGLGEPGTEMMLRPVSESEEKERTNENCRLHI